MVPPVADQVTAELYAPVPATVATHCAVCVVLIEAGDAATEIEVMPIGVEAAAIVILAEPDTLVDPA
jgi:hypothetical protein